MITNKSDISLEMAVWLLFDDYDYVDAPNYISATSLMKPLRHIILPSRIPEDERIVPDVEDQIASALGKALHAAIEKAWLHGNHRKGLQLLGFPKSMIDRVLVNPTPEELAATEKPIPVYIEQRAIRELDGFNIGGKFDLVCDGRVTDTKSTTVYTWIHGGKDEDYKIQGSIYRWLNPDKVTEDHMRINFIFTDWQKVMAASNPSYPQRRVLHKDIELMTIAETEAWIRNKLALVTKYRNVDEAHLPECTDEELWLSAPKYKYYSDPTKTNGRSTKNFDELVEARQFMAEKGKGTVITVPGEPKRCAYCPAFPICSQKDKFSHD